MQKQKMPDPAATIPPVTASGGVHKSALKSETKDELMSEMDRTCREIKSLASKYTGSGDEKVREKLNQESLHLHGQIHVFWDALANEKDPYEMSEEQKLMTEFQKEANEWIESSAHMRKKDVDHVSIANVKTAPDETAGQHIYKKLIHPDNSSVKKLLDSVEEDVMDKLRQKNFHVNEEEFLTRLFRMANYIRTEKAMPAAQVSNAPPIVVTIEPDHKNGNKYDDVVRQEPGEYSVHSPEGTRTKSIIKPIVTGIIMTALAAGLIFFAEHDNKHEVHRHRVTRIEQGANAAEIQMPKSAPQKVGDIRTEAEPITIQHPRNIQIGAVFSRDTRIIDVRLRATAQPGDAVAASTCLINGHTDRDEWFQWGLRSSQGRFYLSQDIWGPGGNLIQYREVPINCKEGDIVQLSMQMVGGKVEMLAKDLRNGAKISSEYGTMGNYFKAGYNNGAITGVMTELWVERDSFDDQQMVVQQYELGRADQGQRLSLFSNSMDLRSPELMTKQSFLTEDDLAGQINGSTGYLQPMENYQQWVNFPETPNLAVSYSASEIRTGNTESIE